MSNNLLNSGSGLLRYVLGRLIRCDLMLVSLVMTLSTIGFITLFRRATAFRGASRTSCATSSWREP